MTVREIVVGDHPALRRKARKIVKVTPEIRKLIEDLIETMRDAPGVGLAAPQVAANERLIVVEYGEEPDEPAETAEPIKKKLYVVLNPEIAWASEETVVGTEGCLSVPGWLGDVSRYEAITVKGLNREGHKITIKVEGWLARIFQHEIDHLDGILYTAKLVSPDTLRRVVEGQEEAGDFRAEAIG